MVLLEPADYARVVPLVPPSRDAGHMAFVWSVLQRTQPGQVWADDRETPRSALVCNDCEFWFAIGEARGDLVDALLPELLRRVPTENTALWCTTPEWEEALAPHFAETERRKEFYFEPAAALETKVALPPVFRLQPIDAVIAARLLPPALDPWLVQVAWGGAEAMAAKSFGWAVLDDDRPVSFCGACAIGGPEGEAEAEIEIITAPDYRRRDLASAAALAFFETCRDRGLTPAWSCAAGNLPSARLGRRLGFIEFREIAGHQLHRGMRRAGSRWHLPAG